MPIDYAARPAAQVRRADRAIDDEGWMIDFLRQAAIGYLATTGTGDQAGQPFINSNLFVYDSDQHIIYMHTARTGRTRTNIDPAETGSAQPVPSARVCFTTTEMGRLLPADEALEFSVEYSGVTAFGSAMIVDETDEQRHGLQLLMDKYFPHLLPERDYRPIVDEELVRTSVYRIEIETWSGKRKWVEDDFPGAFTYPYTPAQGEA